MKRGSPKRDWTDARAKVEEEGCCRSCGKNWRIEAAHVLGRSHDEPHPDRPGTLWVNPLDVVPLCGPATDSGTCHGQQHAHTLDMLAIMSTEEQARAVQVAGSIALAYRELAGQRRQLPEDAGLDGPPAGPRGTLPTVGLYPPTPPPPQE